MSMTFDVLFASGDAINTASRMESTSTAGRIHISQSTFQSILDKDKFIITQRLPALNVKGKGIMETYWLQDYATPVPTINITKSDQVATADSRSCIASGSTTSLSQHCQRMVLKQQHAHKVGSAVANVGPTSPSHGFTTSFDPAGENEKIFFLSSRTLARTVGQARPLRPEGHPPLHGPEARS